MKKRIKSIILSLFIMFFIVADVFAGGNLIIGAKYKYYFWYTVDEPHFLVKSEKNLGNLWELVKFE